MSSLDVCKAKLALAALYLNKAEVRDMICRAMQYGAKFVSNGEPGTAQNIDKTTSLARKVIGLFKFVDDLHALICPSAPRIPLAFVVLRKSKNAFSSTFLFLDQIAWLHRTGIYRDKGHAELLGRISLCFWMCSSVCTAFMELWELRQLSKSMKKLDTYTFLMGSDKYKNEEYRIKVGKANDRTLTLVQTAMDVVVAAGLLKLLPKKVAPRVTGALGFLSSLISLYQLLMRGPSSLDDPFQDYLKEEEVAMTPDNEFLLHELRWSWRTLGIEVEDLKVPPIGRNDFVIGIFDSGICPFSKSFCGKNFGLPPLKWKGKAKDMGPATNKIVGAQNFVDNCESGTDKEKSSQRTCRDVDGHGTVCSGVAAGNFVCCKFRASEAPVCGFLPYARISSYKIKATNISLCWLEHQMNIRKALHAAILDGVDVISMSVSLQMPITEIPSRRKIDNYISKGRIGERILDAFERNILTCMSAGNTRLLGDVSGGFPWVVSCAALAPVKIHITKLQLGDQTSIKGYNYNQMSIDKFCLLVHAESAEFKDPSVQGLLDKEKVKGKIIVCHHHYRNDGKDALAAGAAGIILIFQNKVPDVCEPISFTSCVHHSRGWI